jgi:hypothetical protein
LIAEYFVIVVIVAAIVGGIWVFWQMPRAALRPAPRRISEADTATRDDGKAFLPVDTDEPEVDV